jgi:hypothetical protein
MTDEFYSFFGGQIHQCWGKVGVKTQLIYRRILEGQAVGRSPGRVGGICSGLVVARAREDFEETGEMSWGKVGDS